VPQLAPPIERLIAELAKLPGVGRKTAQRFVFHLLRVPAAEVSALGEALRDLREKTRACESCFNLADAALCPICADPRRDRSLICVVEEPANVLGIERTGAYRGLYHVLGGALSPLRDVGPEDLRVKELLERPRGLARDEPQRRGRGHRRVPGAAAEADRGADHPPGARASGRGGPRIHGRSDPPKSPGRAAGVLTGPPGLILGKTGS